MPTSKTLLPAPYLTLEDINGHALTGGTVTFLDAGTAILAVVYADANGAVISANPLTVDAAGRYTVFLTPGQTVDVEYRDAVGTLIKTVPGVSAIPGSAGNVDVGGLLGEAALVGQVVYLSDGSNGKAAGRWWLAGAGGVLGGQVPNNSLLGMTLVAGSAGASVTIRTAGRVEGLTGLVIGGKYYLSNLAGGLSLQIGTNYRILGQADTTTSLVFCANPWDVRLYVEQQTLAAVVPQLLLNSGGQTMLVATAGATALVQGIRASYHGQRLRLINIGTGRIDLAHQSAGAVAADRLTNWATSAPTSLAPPSAGCAGGSADYEYDMNAPAAWRLVAHEQGDWVTPTFNAADYFGGGGLTWTVTAGQVIRCAYRLHGRLLEVQLNIQGSTFGGVAAPTAFRTCPGGFTTVANASGPLGAFLAAGAVTGALWNTTGASISFTRDLSGAVNWTLGSAFLYGSIQVPVQ